MQDSNNKNQNTEVITDEKTSNTTASKNDFSEEIKPVEQEVETSTDLEITAKKTDTQKAAKTSEPSNDYFGLSRGVSIILAFIPITAWLCGVVTRFKEGHIICALIRLVYPVPIWILDFLSMLSSGKIIRII